MKQSLAILSLLLLAACGTTQPHNPNSIVQIGSPCAAEGTHARDTDGDVAICAENGE